MGNQEQDPFRSFRIEADEHLFADLEMDDSLKEKIRQKAKAEHLEKGRRHWKRIAGTFAAAAIFGIAIIFSIQLPGTQEVQRPVSEQDPATTPETMVAETDGVTLPKTLMHSEDTEDTTGEQSFADLAAAESWFGEKLLLPHDIPENYALGSITGSIAPEGNPQSITLTFANAERQFSITRYAYATEPLMPNGEEVNLNGLKGYLISIDPVELHWSLEDTHYKLMGALSEEEAIRVAKSLEQE